MSKIPSLTIGNLVAKVPIIQGGMGVGISLSKLASAVAGSGGIGVIATAGIGQEEPDLYTDYIKSNNRALRNEIRKARSLAFGILGVNIMVALSNYAEFVETSIDEHIDIIFSGAGLPLELPKYLNKSGYNPKLVPIVSSGRAAAVIIKKWLNNYNYLPDAIVVEGPKAGGHLGFKPEQIFDKNFSLEHLVSDVLKEVKPFESEDKKIPVIAAGGIYTGEDIHRFISMGASGVQMGTRFVTTYECDASNKFKQAYINCHENDITIINSPVGMPGRALSNNFIQDVNKGQKKPYTCPFHCIVTCNRKNAPYCIAKALFNAKKGEFDNGFAFAGTNAFRADKIMKTKELIDLLISEYEMT